VVDDITLRSEVLAVVLRLHRDALPVCELRWSAWRPDYLAELRRLKFRTEKSQWLHLKPCKLSDPHFFIKSIQHTQREVFHDVVAVDGMAIKHLVETRNRAIHGEPLFDRDLSRLVDIDQIIRKCLGLPSTKPVTADWPPKNPPPPPRFPVKPPTVNPAIPQPTSSASFDTDDGKPQILSCYIVCDRSDSMIGDGILAVNESLNALQRTIVADPVISAKCRISVISFSTKAMLELPLSDLAAIGPMPTLDADGVTNYAGAFRETARLINSDLGGLALTHRPLRPVVFFITDGAPTDESWEVALGELVDPGQVYVPSIVVLPVAPIPQAVTDAIRGIPGGAAPRVQAFDIAEPVERAVRRAIDSVTKSIIASAGTEDGEFVAPGLELI
jgi:hypothetical protein